MRLRRATGPLPDVPHNTDTTLSGRHTRDTRCPLYTRERTREPKSDRRHAATDAAGPPEVVPEGGGGLSKKCTHARQRAGQVTRS